MMNRKENTCGTHVGVCEREKESERKIDFERVRRDKVMGQTERRK